jgi:class 3 adenylate cyclase/predicted ATPase
MPIVVASWLQQLGLERYESAFRDNDVDGNVLPDLTGEDLIAIGVTSVGHRRKILSAIAALTLEAPSSVVTTAPGPAPALSPAAAPARDEAERRQLTVMFCDIVGSTALSTQFDPEDLRELISAYHKAVAETVARFDGFVAKYMGDGVLIYFGYPRAHEDDAERSVRAGLAVVDAVAKLPGRVTLQIRVGIATGLAVVGDLIGAGASQERGVVGETPNLAARVQGLAEPNSVVIADGTRRQIGGLFELADLGPKQLAGFAEPQHAWRVLGESGVLSRCEALRSGASPLVGRAEELDLLVRRWEQAKAGEGRVILVSGEPGIGKSRLTAAFCDHIETEPHTRLRYFCAQHHQDSALYPVIVQLERAAGFARDDTVPARLDKLRALLAPGTRDDDDVALLSELLSLPNKAAVLNLSPQRKREKLFEALLSQLEVAARRQPVLMVFEDVHWVDPTSRELLDLIVERVRRLPVLLMITFRPEFQPPWSGLAHVTNLVLNRLGEHDGEALVRTVAGNAALSPGIVAEIIERTDGVPLFVEELTKAVVEGAAREDRTAALLATVSPTGSSVPATLHASLMARLDRLGQTAKEIAQIGSVFGREFTYELIEPVARRPAPDLQAALTQLGAAELLSCRGVAPHASYLFKHALVQDAAYGTLLRGRRQELHGRVVAALEQYFSDLIHRQPELLAHHLTAAGLAERAVGRWLKSGQRAAARLANSEALACFERGLDLLRSLPEGQGRDREEIDLRLAMGLCVMTAKGGAEAQPVYARALELAEVVGEPRQRFDALQGVWQAALLTGALNAAAPLAETLLRTTEQEPDDGLRLQAHHAVWSTASTSGQLAKTLTHADAGRRLYDPIKHESHRFAYGGHDPGVCGGCNAAMSELLLGYPERALASRFAAVALAERLAHPFTLIIAHDVSAIVYLYRREPACALGHFRSAEMVAAEQRLSTIFEHSMMRGATLLGQGAVDEGVALMREGVANLTRLGQTYWLPYGLVHLADGLVRQGNPAEAFAVLRRGLETADVNGQHVWDAELHRVTGTVRWAENRLDESEASLQQAIRIA